MNFRLPIFASFLCLALVVRAGTPTPAVENEIKKIDAVADDPDGKVIVAAAIAEHLKIHRNRLVLLRKETGLSYGQIFVSELEKSGADPQSVLAQARALNADIEKRWGRYRSSGSEQEQKGVRPVLLLNTGFDRAAGGSFYSVVPKVGIESGHASLVVSFPYYKISSTAFSSDGIGDVSATGLLYGNAGAVEAGAGLTAGFPTGDRSRGLGAGKATYDGFGTIGWRRSVAHLFVDGGVANSIFSNVVYQRPYISTGTAAHVAAGLEIRVVPHLTIGGGAFAVRPFGNQTVYSRVAPQDAPAQTTVSPAPSPAQGQAPPETGKGRGDKAVFRSIRQAEVTAADLRDHGADAWASITLARGVSLNFVVARSVPFQLTTVHAGLTLDVARLIPGLRHF